MQGSTAVLVSKRSFSTQTVFFPLKLENAAARKHRIAAITKAVVNAVMNGEAMAFGKNVWLVKVFNVF